jgi:hypothetical protein
MTVASNDAKADPARTLLRPYPMGRGDLSAIEVE